jgi:hypothetical protein
MKILWTQERISTGFKKFSDDHQRLPTASEVDRYAYLPSSRYIQRRFGGLEKLRTELGYTDAHFGKGYFRSTIATEAGERSRILREDLQLVLQTHFGADNVNIEKTFLGKYRVNFYVHTPAGNFGIDIFYAKTLRTLQSSINIKMKKYTNFTDPLYLVVANELLHQGELDTYVARKKYPLPANIRLLSTDALCKAIPEMTPYNLVTNP